MLSSGLKATCVIISTFAIFGNVCESLDDELTDIQSSTEGHVTYESNKRGIMHGCRLVHVLNDTGDYMKALKDVGKNMIKNKLTVNGDNLTLTDPSTDLYNPLEWIVITGLAGRSLLLLKETFDSMSIQTLGVGLATLDIELKQKPANCLIDQNVSLLEIERYIRVGILQNFEETLGVDVESEVCNRHVVENTRHVGELIYVCCRIVHAGQLECEEVQESFWIWLLVNMVFLLQVLAVLYSPTMLPDSLYRLRAKFIGYKYSADVYNKDTTQTENATRNQMATDCLKLNVMAIEQGSKPDINFQPVKKLALNKLKQLQNSLRNVKKGKVVELEVQSVELAVKANKILAEGYVPVGLFQFLKNFAIRCKLRKEIPSIGKCCKEDMCKMLPYKTPIPWYKCSSYFAGACFGLVLLTPWFIRVWFYYTHEHSVMEYKRKAFTIRNMTMPLSGTLVSNLSPTHPLFCFIYLLVFFEAILLLLLPKSLQDKLKFIVRQCFRDWKETSTLDACAVFITQFLLPLQKFGLVGCVLCIGWIFILPFILIILALKVLPIINITYRLFVNLIYYLLNTVYPQSFETQVNVGRFRVLLESLRSVLVIDHQDDNNRSNKSINVFALAMSLVTIWLSLLLLWECTYFYIECVVYTIFGIILNSSAVMRLVTLLVIIIYYAYDCANSVHARYVTFNKALTSQIEKLVGEKVESLAMCSSDAQSNTAFKVPPKTKQNTRMQLVSSSQEGRLKWRTDRLLLFLNKYDIQHIPKSFFLKFAQGSHFSCPGPVHLLYLKALLDFCLILIFLVFVFVVIIAFGQARDASHGSQAIATLASGFLPLVFRKFLFKSHSAPSLDPNNIKWQATFREEVGAYIDDWTISDIMVTKDDFPVSVENIDIEPGSPALSEQVSEDVSEQESLITELPVAEDSRVNLLLEIEDDEIVKVFVPKTNETEKNDNQAASIV